MGTKTESGGRDFSSLRKRTEKILARKADRSSGDCPDDIRKLIHELDVHQIELEMQNNELREAQAVIEESRSQLSDLYDFAPVPYVTLNSEGLILQANLKAADLFEAGRSSLLQRRFSSYIVPEDHGLFRRHRLETIREPGKHSCELRLLRKDGSTVDVVIESTGAEDKDKEGRFTQFRSVLWNVTAHKQMEGRIYATNALLDLFSKKPIRKEYLDAVVDLIQQWCGCKNVGIRILDKKGYIPYESYKGFSKEFWEAESLLSVDRDQCICTRVVTQRPGSEVERQAMTPGGSFRCDEILKFADKLTEEEKSRLRGLCIRNGYRSLAVIPITYQQRIFGAIHLADGKAGMVPAEKVEFIETMTPLIGEAINRFNLEDELRESHARLRTLSSQLLNIQESERKRIALEVHDSLGQSLNAIKFKIQDTMTRVEKENETAAQRLGELLPVIQEGIEEARRIQMDLRPSILDDLGINATISWFCRQFRTTYGSIEVKTLVNVQEKLLPAVLKTAIFRTAQEAMNNVAKHSAASRVALSLVNDGNEVQLTVEDNGQGFDLDQTLSEEGREKGLGLTSMRERAELSGGTFSIQSTKGKGTTVRLSWPL